MIASALVDNCVGLVKQGVPCILYYVFIVFACIVSIMATSKKGYYAYQSSCVTGSLQACLLYGHLVNHTTQVTLGSFALNSLEHILLLQSSDQRVERYE